MHFHQCDPIWFNVWAQASKKLKSAVRDNYGQFIETAAEVQRLENDMLELRNHITEVNSLIKGIPVLDIIIRIQRSSFDV